MIFFVFLVGLVMGLLMVLVIYGNGFMVGSDIIVLLCNKYFKWKIFIVIFIFDVFVVIFLVFKIGFVKMFWMLVMVVIISKSLDWFL